MIWAVLGLYALAGVTIGRLVYELGVFRPVEPDPDLFPSEARSREIRACVRVGAVWLLLPIRAVVEYVGDVLRRRERTGLPSGPGRVRSQPSVTPTTEE